MAIKRFKDQQAKSSMVNVKDLGSAKILYEGDDIEDSALIQNGNFITPEISPRGEKIRILNTGLEFDDDVTLDDIKAFAEKLKAVDTMIQFMWGDLANQCQIMKMTETEMSDVATLSGYTIGSLYNFAGIARLFSPDMRGKLPSFTHYKYFYEYGVTDKRSLRAQVELCIRENWSSRDLEYYLNTGKHPTNGKPTLSAQMTKKTDRQIVSLKKKFSKADEDKKRLYAEIAQHQMQRWAEVYAEMTGDD